MDPSSASSASGPNVVPRIRELPTSSRLLVRSLYVASTPAEILSVLLSGAIQRGATSLAISICLPASTDAPITCTVSDHGGRALDQELLEEIAAVERGRNEGSRLSDAAEKLVAIASICEAIQISSIKVVDGAGLAETLEIVRTGLTAAPRVQRVHRRSKGSLAGSRVEIQGLFSYFPVRRAMALDPSARAREITRILRLCQATALLNPALELGLWTSESGASQLRSILHCHDTNVRRKLKEWFGIEQAEHIEAQSDTMEFACWVCTNAPPSHENFLFVNGTLVQYGGPEMAQNCIATICGESVERHALGQSRRASARSVAYVMWLKISNSSHIVFERAGSGSGAVIATIHEVFALRRLLDQGLRQLQTETPVQRPIESTHDSVAFRREGGDDLETTRFHNAVTSRPILSSKTSHPTASVRELLASWKNPSLAGSGSAEKHDFERTSSSQNDHQEAISFSRAQLEEARIVGYVNNQFILILMDSCLVAVDQHAAHERVQLEYLQNRMSEEVFGLARPSASPVPIESAKRRSHSNNVGLQLLGTTKVDLECMISANDSMTLDTHGDHVRKWGWAWRREGHTRVVLTQVPLVLGTSALNARGFLSFLQQIRVTPVTWPTSVLDCLRAAPQGILDVIATQACHTAVRFGDQLHLTEQQRLLSDLQKCRQPFQCAHGRPSIALLKKIAKSSSD